MVDKKLYIEDYMKETLKGLSDSPCCLSSVPASPEREH
jgi:hypothetical protein